MIAMVLKEETLEKLQKLESFLKPHNLLERARVYAFSERFDRFDIEDIDLEDEELPSWKRADKITRELGFLVAQDRDTFNTLLPELVSNYASRLYNFGQGLFDGSSNKEEFWKILYSQLERTEPEKRQYVVLLGYLSASVESFPEFYNSTLDSLVNDELLGKWFPVFQGDTIVDKQSVERLHKALDSGKAAIETFRHLAYGRHHEK